LAHRLTTAAYGFGVEPLFRLASRATMFGHRIGLRIFSHDRGLADLMPAIPGFVKHIAAIVDGHALKPDVMSCSGYAPAIVT